MVGPRRAHRPGRARLGGNRVPFTGINPASSLTIYSPEDRMLYVYQGATTGNSHVTCSFRIHIPRVGEPIDRENCAPGSLTR